MLQTIICNIYIYIYIYIYILYIYIYILGPYYSFLFVNAKKIYQFKGKNSEIKDYALCLGNISKDNINKQD